MAKEDQSFDETVRKHYADLMAHCRQNLDKIEGDLPDGRVDFSDALKAKGLSRRDFMKWSAVMTSVLMLPPMFRPLVARAAENFNRLPIIWLHFAECTGCSEAFLRSSYPNVDELILDTLSIEYHETLMAAAGHQAEANLKKAMEDFKGKYICVIEGAIPTGHNGDFCRIGPTAKSALEIGREVTKDAAAVICIGSCSSFGNIQAAKPNPTEAKGVRDALDVKTVNISGCPPNPANFVGTVLHFLMFGGLPPLDHLGRPLWAYGTRIHDYCERRPHYDAGEYVAEWGDDGAKKGWCLYKMGCKGPYTYANCSRARFNDATSWPIMSGHGCIGCVEPKFWDTMAPLEKPIADQPIIGGIEKSVDQVGIGLAAVAAVGIGVHAAAAAGKRHGIDRGDSKQDSDEAPKSDKEQGE